MRTILLVLAVASIGSDVAFAAEDKAGKPQADAKRVDEINQLVGRLNADRAPERDDAEKKLLELTGASAAQSDRVLEALPKDSDQMPLALRDRLARIRQQLEDRAAKISTAATTLTLSAKEMPLAEVIAAIEKQTGNRLINNSDQQGGEGRKVNASIELKNEQFWPALDKILDKVMLGAYPYSGKDTLSIVGRDPVDRPRFGHATYQGPFRLEVTDVQADRNLRQPKQTSLKLQLEVAWEPRLRPIAISQPVGDVNATTEEGTALAASQQQPSFDVEVPAGTQAAEISLSFDLPAREVKKIKTLHGKLHALVPGRQVKFRFTDLANATGKTHRQGGVQVTLDEVRKNNAVWEVHMSFALDEDNGALQSHRDWVLQNLSYMLDKAGKQIDNGGLETTRQTKSDVGVVYIFDLPEGLEGMTWVYETPAAIVELPIEYDIKDIELP
jgi:hypothetical protein